jgi:hypothetical protein
LRRESAIVIPPQASMPCWPAEAELAASLADFDPEFDPLRTTTISGKRNSISPRFFGA